MTPLEIAETLRSLRPDRGNRYASRTVRTKGAAAFALWQEMCRHFAYRVCVTKRAMSEMKFYDACGYDEP